MAILFDLDGTLIDTAPDFALAMAQMRACTDPTPSLDTIRLAIPNGIKALAEVGFENHLNPLKTENELLNHYEQALGLEAKLFDGIGSLLTALDTQNILWGIVTNKEARFTNPLLKKLNLWDRAACVVSGDTTAHTKPHPEPLFYACQEIDCQPSHCIYVGDAERDIVAGKNAGMATIGALFGYIKDIETAKKWGANHYVEHPSDILPWVEQWLQTR